MLNFEVVGLSIRDKRVYHELISHPKASIRNIAEATSINRGSVYESLKVLMSIGLVAHIKTGATVRYVAEDPEKLHEIINEKRRRLLDSHIEVDAYIKELSLERIEPGSFQFATFYDGDEGMASILRDVLTTCRLQNIEQYSVISSPHVAEYLYTNFRNYTRERIKQGLHVRVLRQGRAAQQDVELSEWRILPQDPVDTDCYTIIYGSKVAIVSIDAINHTSGIIIDNNGVSQTQLNVFNLLWKQLS